MSERPALFEDAIEFLTFCRDATIAEAANIPESRWDFRPHPKARSVQELVRHIVESTAMLVGEASDREGDFQRRPPQEHVRAHLGELAEDPSPDDLKESLRRTGESNPARVRDAGPELMATVIRRFDGGTWSRLMYVFYAGSHESYHCGQLAIYARTMGLVPALTQRIHGDDAK
jgi:uncharacterized damage-inducible protein DinB